MSSLALVRQPVYKKENSDLKPVVFHLKIDLVSHPTCAEGLVNIYISTIYAHNLPRLYTLNVDRLNRRKCFDTLKKKNAKSRLYSAKIIKDVDNVNDRVLLANKSA